MIDNKKRVTMIVYLTTIFLAACAPSQQAIQTAIAQTQAANPSSTFTPNPPTETQTKTPTETLTITLSPTPDLLTLQLNLKDFLLQKSDLPLDARYYLINQYSERLFPNEEVKQGAAYLVETGRIDGWRVFYNRGSDNGISPEEIFDYVVLYKTPAGAQLEITKYSDNLVAQEGYTEEFNPPEIGDKTRAFILVTNIPGKEEYKILYRIIFSYRNIVHDVNAYGWAHEVQPDFVRDIASLLLTRLQASPLINP